jgi:5,10-methylene-tetrahydrofolate dehydrogenase/methenyl tetrahydrofolate cyclohydrolase
VNGILLEHHVPSRIDDRECFDRLSVEKNVDGLKALGFSKMVMGEPKLGSTTPVCIIRSSKHLGNIELSAVVDRCASFTLVPGVVGPLIVATLISQTVEAAKKAAMVK